MADHARDQRLPENAAVRALFGRVDTQGGRIGKIEEALKHLVSHKALMGYAALAFVAICGGVWVVMLYFHSIQKDEVVEIKANAYRQETKVDGLKDLLMTGQLKSAWQPAPPPAPEVKEFIEQAEGKK